MARKALNSVLSMDAQGVATITGLSAQQEQDFQKALDGGASDAELQTLLDSWYADDQPANTNAFKPAAKTNLPKRETLRAQLVNPRVLDKVILYTAVDATGRTLAQNVSLQKSYVEAVAKNGEFSTIFNADGTIKEGKEAWVDLNADFRVANSTTFMVTAEQLANYKVNGDIKTALTQVIGGVTRYALYHAGTGVAYSFKGLVPEKLAIASSNAAVASVSLRATLTTTAQVEIETREAKLLSDNQLTELRYATIAKEMAAIDLLPISDERKEQMRERVLSKI